VLPDNPGQEDYQPDILSAAVDDLFTALVGPFDSTEEAALGALSLASLESAGSEDGFAGAVGPVAISSPGASGGAAATSGPGNASDNGVTALLTPSFTPATPGQVGTIPAPDTAAGVRAEAPASIQADLDPARKAEVLDSYGRLAPRFEANLGQFADSSVQFLSRGSGHALFLSATQAELVFLQSNASAEGEQVQDVSRTAIRMELVGANPNAQASGVEQLVTRTNYLFGNDASKWVTDVPNYAGVQYHGVYSGIDAVYYYREGQLE
jgi:hypothetical protein